MKARDAALLLLLLAVISIWGIFKVPRERADIESQRVSISLKDLRQKRDNFMRHWRLKDFHFAPNYVWRDDAPYGIDVWIPLFANGDVPNGQVPADADLQDVLRFTVDNQHELQQMLTRDEINVQLLGSSDFQKAQIEFLKKHHYPGLNPRRCRLICASPDPEPLTGGYITAAFCLIGSLVFAFAWAVVHFNLNRFVGKTRRAYTS